MALVEECCAELGVINGSASRGKAAVPRWLLLGSWFGIVGLIFRLVLCHFDLNVYSFSIITGYYLSRGRRCACLVWCNLRGLLTSVSVRYRMPLLERASECSSLWTLLDQRGDMRYIFGTIPKIGQKCRHMLFHDWWSHSSTHQRKKHQHTNTNIIRTSNLVSFSDAGFDFRQGTTMLIVR